MRNWFDQCGYIPGNESLTLEKMAFVHDRTAPLDALQLQAQIARHMVARHDDFGNIIIDQRHQCFL